MTGASRQFDGSKSDIYQLCATLDDFKRQRPTLNHVISRMIYQDYVGATSRSKLKSHDIAYSHNRSIVLRRLGRGEDAPQLAPQPSDAIFALASQLAATSASTDSDAPHCDDILLLDIPDPPPAADTPTMEPQPLPSHSPFRLPTPLPSDSDDCSVSSACSLLQPPSYPSLSPPSSRSVQSTSSLPSSCSLPSLPSVSRSFPQIVPALFSDLSASAAISSAEHAQKGPSTRPADLRDHGQLAVGQIAAPKDAPLANSAPATERQALLPSPSPPPPVPSLTHPPSDIAQSSPRPASSPSQSSLSSSSSSSLPLSLDVSPSSTPQSRVSTANDPAAVVLGEFDTQLAHLTARLLAELTDQLSAYQTTQLKVLAQVTHSCRPNCWPNCRHNRCSNWSATSPRCRLS